MIEGIPRWIRWILIPLLVLFAIYLLLYAVLSSTAFSRFALNRVESVVPELAFSELEGSLAQVLQFNLRYSTPGTGLEVERVRLSLQPSCLWQMTVCIESLRIDELRVALSSDESDAEVPSPDSEKAADLPEIALPMDIAVESLTIGSLLVSQDDALVYQLEHLDSSLDWRQSTLDIRHLTARDAYCEWSMQGEATLVDRYPLALNVACESVAGYGVLAAEIRGDLEQLAVEVNARVVSDYSVEPLPLHATFSLAPFDPQLPMAFELSTATAVQLKLGEQSLALDAALLSAEGPLLSPEIDASLSFENPYWEGKNRLLLQALATTEQLTVRSLSLQLPEGQLDVSGELDYGEAVAWKGALVWQDIDLEQFDPALAGELSGELTSRVNYLAGDLRAQVNLESLSGTWLERKLSASGQFDWQNDRLAINDLWIRQGDNHLSVAGDFSPTQRLDLALQLSLPHIGELIPEAWAPVSSGELRGDITLAGTLDDLVIDSNLTVSDLEYSDIQLARGQLRLQWFGVSQRSGRIYLSLERLAVAEDLLSDLSLQGQGNIGQHSLQLAMSGLDQHSDKSVQLECSGGFADGQQPQPFARWQGNCGELMIGFALNEEQQSWRLASPIAIDARPQLPAVTISGFCLNNQSASLCSQESIRFDQGELSAVTLEGERLPLQWARAFLPGEDVSVQGTWGFDFQGDQLLGDPQLSATLSSSDLALRWQLPRQGPLVLQVTDLGVDWRLLDQEQHLTWRLQTATSGSSRGELSIVGSRMEGNASISALQLADYSRLFLPGPEDELSGEVNADLNVAGTIEQPVLSGQLSLVGGRFATEVLPVPLRDMQLDVSLEDNRALAEGSFRAAESDGDISGQFVWGTDSWSGELAVSAEPLMLRPEPDVRLQVAPDLQFTFTSERIAITGQLLVPQAQVEITELPEQAETVSPDAVIVDEEEAQDAPSAIAVNTNIELILGEKVHFEGFGLETRVTGSLRLQQSSGELLKANGRLQLVEGRYQAYGQNLLIRSGDLVFVGDLDNPQLRLEAVRADTPEDVVVGLRVSGPARNPQVALFSRPDMAQQAQLSFLLTGNPPGADIETDPQLAAAEAALSYALESDLGAGITSRAGRALGIEDFRVTAGGTDNGAQIGLSGYITPNLLVRYGVGVFEAINTVTLRYQLTKNIYLEAISGEASDLGLMWSFERD